MLHSGPVSHPTFALFCTLLVRCKNCMDTWYESPPPASYPKCMSQDGTRRAMTGLYQAVHALRNNSPYYLNVHVYMVSNNVDFLFHFLNRNEYSVVNNSIFVYYLKRKATPNKDILLCNDYCNACYTLNQIQWLETKAGIYIGIDI